MATTYLQRTNTSGTSTQKGTISVWIKSSKEPSGNNQTTLASWGDANNHGALLWNGSDKIDAFDYQSGYASQLQTNAVLRDASAWYHFVYSWDTTLSTANDRQKIYINGVEQTYSTRTNYSVNATTSWNANSYSMRVGALNSSSYFRGSMSHIHFIDGTAYDASTFGSTDATTGEWKINTSPSVTYGTNGFFILKDGNSVTDQSGNSNNFTVGGGTLTNTEDCPSNVFATLNPLLDVNAVGTYSNGNLGFTGTGSTNFGGCSMPVSKGKWYVEVKATTVSGSYPIIGVIDAQSSKRRDGTYFVGADINTNNPSGFAVFSNGDIYHNNNNNYGNLTTTYTSGDIIGMALDMDSATKTLAFYKNGTLETTINLDEPPNGSYIFCTAIYATYSSAKTDWNFGNGYFGTTAISSEGTNASGIGKFEYDVPTGYTALSTKGLNE